VQASIAAGTFVAPHAVDLSSREEVARGTFVDFGNLGLGGSAAKGSLKEGFHNKLPRDRWSCLLGAFSYF
jgi:hypothetical protein